MPGGLLALVCYGNENVILNGNPQVTWFYKSFQQYTHFSQEPIQIPLEGPNQLQMDAPIVIKAKIPRQGDLLSDLTLRVTLPDIFSKLYVTSQNTTNNTFTTDRAASYEFAWVRQVGVRMIQSITFTIGGQTIQQFTADWISARAVLDYDNTQYQKWRTMVGDVTELFDPAQGMYADPAGGYPNVVSWVTQPTQNNAASIPGRILRIPLGLWFSDSIANSLPLVALQYHDCEVTIQMAPIRDLYTILDPNGIRVRPGVRVGPYLPTDQYVNVWNPDVLGALPPTLNNNYVADPDIRETMRNFLTDIPPCTVNPDRSITYSTSTIPNSDGWSLNATLEGIYTFVQDKERLMFTQKTLRYTIRQVQPFYFTGISTRNTYRLDVHNIATRVVYFARRTDSIPGRNQPTNLTNWMYTAGPQRPYGVPQSERDYVTRVVLPNAQTRTAKRSGLNIQGTQRNILRNVFLTANGNTLFDSEDTNFFTQYVPFRYLKGYGMPYGDYGLATQGEMWPIHTYSFALRGSESDQPTGTLNTSRIDRLEMDVDVESIPVGARYTYELDVFVETLNFVEISAGLGGLKFAK